MTLTGNIFSANHASDTAPGIVQLTEDLGGTWNSPVVYSTHLSAPLPLGQGGTGQNNAQSAINILTSAPSNGGKYLRSDGANATFQTIIVADLPDSTASAKGILQLSHSGDVWGTASVPII